MKAPGCLIVLAWLGVLAWPAAAHTGEVILRSRDAASAADLTVMASPAPLRAGPVEVHALVQDAGTRDALPAARVAFVFRRLGGQAAAGETYASPACCPLHHPAAATGEEVTALAQPDPRNRLFQSARIILPSAGRWECIVRIDGAAPAWEARTELNVQAPASLLASLLPWLMIPPIGVLILAAHPRLLRSQ